jgi:hypothetical protein
MLFSPGVSGLFVENMLGARCQKRDGRNSDFHGSFDSSNYFSDIGTIRDVEGLPLTTEDILMPTTTMADTARLHALLDEALTLADTLQLPLAAIHIDQALAQLSDVDVPAL